MSDSGLPPGRLGYVLVRAAAAVRQVHARHLAELGLLPHQHAVLASLDTTGATHQKELAARVAVDPGDIVAHLDGLQSRGCVTRDRDPADRRRQVVTLTEAGARLLADADHALAAAEEEAFGALDAGRRQQLYRDALAVLDSRRGEPQNGETAAQ